MRFLLVLTLLLVVPVRQPATPYDVQFTADTMRVDYFHTGGPRAGETFALDQVVNDGPWAGSRTTLVDDTNLGPYCARGGRSDRLLARLRLDLRGMGGNPVGFCQVCRRGITRIIDLYAR